MAGGEGKKEEGRRGVVVKIEGGYGRAGELGEGLLWPAVIVATN